MEAHKNHTPAAAKVATATKKNAEAAKTPPKLARSAKNSPKSEATPVKAEPTAQKSAMQQTPIKAPSTAKPETAKPAKAESKPTPNAHERDQERPKGLGMVAKLTSEAEEPKTAEAPKAVKPEAVAKPEEPPKPPLRKAGENLESLIARHNREIVAYLAGHAPKSSQPVRLASGHSLDLADIQPWCAMRYRQKVEIMRRLDFDSDAEFAWLLTTSNGDPVIACARLGMTPTTREEALGCMPPNIGRKWRAAIKAWCK